MIYLQTRKYKQNYSENIKICLQEFFLDNNWNTIEVFSIHRHLTSTVSQIYLNKIYELM